MNGRERVRKGADEGRRMRWEDSVEEDRRGRSGRPPCIDPRNILSTKI